MARSSRSGDGETPRILLVALRPEEEDAVARYLAATGGTATLRSASGLENARNAARAGGLRALVCSFDLFPALADSLPELLGPGSSLPALVLAPPGSEPLAAALLEREGTDVLLQAGDYRPLLLAWVRRTLARREPSWEEVGRIVRHEINNPLTGVLGNAELILADPEPLSAPVRARLRTIVDLAVRMRDVVRSLEVRLQRPHSFPRPPQTPGPPPGPFELLARELIR
ncbi:MAG: histidine kinase dimerization/phospho-acceptor domain-containing protein [Candidatus Acidiferrales bacterium]